MGKKLEFLDYDLCHNLREAINSSPIFTEDLQYLSKYNLCCAVMDRLDTCIEKLNTYGDYPESEEDFLVFMMFACMLTDAVKQILIALGVENKKPSSHTDRDYQFFQQAYLESKIYNKTAEMPTDDQIFEYFRALSFAHPFETSRPRFLQKNETQYSPWVIVNKMLSEFRDKKDLVGVRIYSSLSENILNFEVSFDTLKRYLVSRYERIAFATNWVKEEIERTHSHWREKKLERKQDPLEIFKEIYTILKSRHEDAFGVYDAIAYLSCEITESSNEKQVKGYRNFIAETLPELCDAIDDINHELAAEIIDRIYKRPTNTHQQFHYQMEKIFCYLTKDASFENQLWGLKQVGYFSESFAKKWVVIKPNEMSYDEIKLLVRTACYLEWKEQEK